MATPRYWLPPDWAASASQAATPNAGLLLATRGDSPGATAVLRVYTNATDFSITTINIPDQATTEELFVPFSAFVVGGGAGATFSSVGAIELLINGVSDLDATVTVLRQPATERSALEPGERSAIRRDHQVHERPGRQHRRQRPIRGD